MLSLKKQIFLYAIICLWAYKSYAIDFSVTISREEFLNKNRNLITKINESFFETGPVLDQKNSNFCYAFVAADLIRKEIDVPVSPLLIALNYSANFKTPTDVTLIVGRGSTHDALSVTNQFCKIPYEEQLLYKEKNNIRDFINYGFKHLFKKLEKRKVIAPYSKVKTFVYSEAENIVDANSKYIGQQVKSANKVLQHDLNIFSVFLYQGSEANSPADGILENEFISKMRTEILKLFGKNCDMRIENNKLFAELKCSEYDENFLSLLPSPPTTDFIINMNLKRDDFEPLYPKVNEKHFVVGSGHFGYDEMFQIQKIDQRHVNLLIADAEQMPKYYNSIYQFSQEMCNTPMFYKVKSYEYGREGSLQRAYHLILKINKLLDKGKILGLYHSKQEMIDQGYQSGHVVTVIGRICNSESECRYLLRDSLRPGGYREVDLDWLIKYIIGIVWIEKIDSFDMK